MSYKRIKECHLPSIPYNANDDECLIAKQIDYEAQRHEKSISPIKKSGNHKRDIGGEIEREWVKEMSNDDIAALTQNILYRNRSKRQLQ